MTNNWELNKKLPNQVNQEIINDFLLSLKLENRSEKTIYYYRYFLERFFGDMIEPYSSISSETILQWFFANQSHLKEVSLHSRLSILSSFFTFCIKEELLLKSPIKSRWYPRLPKSVPKYLEKGELAITRLQAESLSPRNRLMVEFLLTSGCRVSEIAGLNWEDVDIANRTARVLGKGKKVRQVHFTEKCAVLFERYLNYHKYKTGAIFVSSIGARLGIRRIQIIINELGQNAELSSRLFPHRFRHSFATELLAKGAELSFIADELGHNDLGTTKIYAQLPKQEIISLYRKFMG